MCSAFMGPSPIHCVTLSAGVVRYCLLSASIVSVCFFELTSYHPPPPYYRWATGQILLFGCNAHIGTASHSNPSVILSLKMLQFTSSKEQNVSQWPVTALDAKMWVSFFSVINSAANSVI